MRTFSMRAPLASSRRSADWQNGHAAVQYISTVAMPWGMFLFLHRQPGLLPRVQAAREIDDAGEAQALERRRGLGGAVAAVAVDDQRPLLFLPQILAAVVDARQRHVLRAEDVARAILAR